MLSDITANVAAHITTAVFFGKADVAGRTLALPADANPGKLFKHQPQPSAKAQNVTNHGLDTVLYIVAGIAAAAFFWKALQAAISEKHRGDHLQAAAIAAFVLIVALAPTGFFGGVKTFATQIL